MRVFAIKQRGLSMMSEKAFAKEKQLQQTIEENLDLLFGLQYVRSEMVVEDFRLDTVAYDRDAGSFVILEFKPGTSYSVVDQGMAYLAAMLRNKAEFVLEYSERMAQNLKRADVDWSQSRVMFVAPSFTRYQIAAIMADMPIELWEVRRYEPNVLSVRAVETPAGTASIKEPKLSEKVKSVATEVKVYTVDDLIRADWGRTRELADLLVEGMQQAWPECETRYRKYFFYFMLPDKTRLAEAIPQKRGIQAYVTPKLRKLPPSGLKFEDCSQVGRWVMGNSRVRLRTAEDVEEFVLLVQRLYRKR